MKRTFAPLRHAYAITCHKSQGLTFDCALVDFSDLSRMPDARIQPCAVCRGDPFPAIPGDGGVMSIDANVERVREKLRARSSVGFVPHGHTTERDDLNRLDWLKHAQEEAMDLAVYLERLIQDEQRMADDGR